MKYKVLIPTSGIGSRLGDITKYTNKALIRVGKKPAISYIIERYPKEIPLIVTLGYFGNHVRDFLKLAYPDRKIDFVTVDKYDGTGSSLGYSMLKGKNLLQCPFIYHACDTITEDPIPMPNKNWIAGFKGDDSSSYGSWKVLGGEKIIFNDKGALDFDYLHMGIIGIHDYSNFWNTLSKLYRQNPKDSTLNDCATVINMISSGRQFDLVNFKSWFDISSTAALEHARKNINDTFHNLDKLEESIFVFKDFVIKFFHDKKMIEQRVERAKILDNLVPKILGVTENFYKYEYVPGKLYSEAARAINFRHFLEWAEKNLWQEHIETDDDTFKQNCHNFYYQKTIERIEKLQKAHSIEDKSEIINDLKVPPLKEILEHINFDWLTSSVQKRFHGDFILDNIIKTRGGYRLLDWRQNFGGMLHAGDQYYDLAKLNHNLIVNHEIVSQNLFNIKIERNRIFCDIMRKHNLVDCQGELFNFLNRKGYDVKKVKILTPLIWLNSSPLHHYPYNLFLYYFGKYNLWKELKKYR